MGWLRQKARLAPAFRVRVCDIPCSWTRFNETAEMLDAIRRENEQLQWVFRQARFPSVCRILVVFPSRKSRWM